MVLFCCTNTVPRASLQTNSCLRILLFHHTTPVDTFQLQLGEFPFPDNLGSLLAVSSERLFQHLTPRIARNSLPISRLKFLVSDSLLLLVLVQLFKR